MGSEVPASGHTHVGVVKNGAVYMECLANLWALYNFRVDFGVEEITLAPLKSS